MSLQGENLKGIADAIRAKKGTSDPIKASDFASEILSIETGTGAGGKYNIRVVYNADGTQTLHITDWDYENSGSGGSDAPDYTPKYSRVFSENTPAQISAVSAEIAKNGYNSAQVAEIYGWNLGDTITIPLTTGENIEMQIIGFNHDANENALEGEKVGITLQMVNCLATMYPMDSEPNTDYFGYLYTELYDATFQTIEYLLPQEWRDVIKTITKDCAENVNGSTFEEHYYTFNLFLLSEYEVMGKTNYCDIAEGEQYEFYANGSSSDRIKSYDRDGDGVADTAVRWWLRTPYTSDPRRFCVIRTSGSGEEIMEVTKSYGVSFAFCV